jgi:hypothetical protein
VPPDAVARFLLPPPAPAKATSGRITVVRTPAASYSMRCGGLTAVQFWVPVTRLTSPEGQICEVVALFEFVGGV